MARSIRRPASSHSIQNNQGQAGTATSRTPLPPGQWKPPVNQLMVTPLVQTQMDTSSRWQLLQCGWPSLTKWQAGSPPGYSQKWLPPETTSQGITEILIPEFATMLTLEPPTSTHHPHTWLPFELDHPTTRRTPTSDPAVTSVWITPIVVDTCMVVNQVQAEETKHPELSHQATRKNLRHLDPLGTDLTISNLPELWQRLGWK